MKISFIIPAYNASSYIERCLDSIFSLSMAQSDFEVIVVDDCSTDGTADIVKNYAKRHDNIILMVQESNHRQGAARNVALAAATGEYVTFVDSDDTIERGIESALEITNGEDIVICRANIESKDGKITLSNLEKEPQHLVDGPTFMRNNYDWHFVGAPWGYLFRRNFLMQTSIPFASDVSTEDEDWIHIHLFLARTIICSPNVIYTNYYNASGTTKSKRTLFMDYSRIMCSCREFQYAERYCKDDQFMYDWLREIAAHHVEMTFKRLWKTEATNYSIFFNMFTKNTYTELLSRAKWSKRALVMLKYPRISALLLNIMAPLLRTFKKINI